MRFDHEVTVGAPADVVWDVMADLEGWPTWTSSIRSLRREAASPLEVGLRVHVRQPKLPPAVWTVTHVRPGQSFTWEATGPGVRTRASHVIAPNGNSSIVYLSLDQQGVLGRLIGLLGARLTRRYLALEGAGLKARSEQRSHESRGGDS